MIFSSGTISGYDSKGRYDGSQRTRIEGVSHVSAITAVSETRKLKDERFRQSPRCIPQGDFRELFEQDPHMLEQAGNYLLTIRDIKMSVLKQIIKRMKQIKEPWIKEEACTTVLRTQWVKNAVDSAFLKDTCCVAYETNGFALYSSGRNMLFDICVEMTDVLCEKYENVTYQSSMITEPIIVRLDDRITEIPHIRCLFDWDCAENNTDLYSGLKIMMQDANGYHIRVDLQEENAGTLYRRSIADSKRLLHKNICFGKIDTPEKYNDR